MFWLQILYKVLIITFQISQSTLTNVSKYGYMVIIRVKTHDISCFLLDYQCAWFEGLLCFRGE